MNVIKTKHYHMYIPEGQHSKLDCLWQSEICRGHSQTPAPLERSDPGLHDASDPNEPPSAFCSNGTKTQGGVKERKKKKSWEMCKHGVWADVTTTSSTHLDLLGVSRSYSTWCLSGMRGRMASNSGKRFGSLMTSFRSPTSTGRSIALRDEASKNKHCLITQKHKSNLHLDLEMLLGNEAWIHAKKNTAIIWL